MANSINASLTAGLVQTADTSGIINLQSGGSTIVAVTSTGAAVTGTLSSTGNTTLGDASTDTLNVGNGDLIKDASGNVGIGTATPASKFDTTYTNATAYSTANTIQYYGATFRNTTAGGYGNVVIRCTDATAGANNFVSLNAVSEASGNAATAFTIGTRNSAGDASEKMRIDSSGNLLVGTTSPITVGRQTTSYNGGTYNGLVLSESANTANTTFISFNNGATSIGSIYRAGATAAVVYLTTSDERLKSNIANASPVLDKLMTVKVRQYDWTEGNTHQDYGFIAQELEPVLSGIVFKGKTEEDVWGLDYSRLTPHLVKAIQELKAIVDTQAEQIKALQGAK